MKTHHKPVMLEESVDYLVTNKSGLYFDATLGFGGHTEAFLKILNDDAKLIATDVDDNAFSFSKKKFEHDSRVELYKFNFSLIDVIAKIESVDGFDGIFADLGVSSFQLDDPSSGFTYRQDTKLDLRMDKTKTVTAADIVNTFTKEDLSDILWKYGEEKKARRISETISAVRDEKKIETTGELSDLISTLVPEFYLKNTLSRVFQALRIYVNDELEILKSFLKRSIELLKPGGRIVVISYHSLEDRIVKDIFKEETKDSLSPKEDPFGAVKIKPDLKVLTKKPVAPKEKEIKNNSRSRSAKLRAAEKI